MTHNGAFVAAIETDDYWELSRRPLSCLVFLLPLLCLYELGVIWLGGNSPDSLRNGADYWMRSGLQEIGLANPYLLPGLVVGCLLLWQIFGKYAWQISPETLLGMSIESLLFAFALIVLGQLQSLAFQHYEAVTMSATAPVEHHGMTQIITFIGAGLYEEVLFRLCLLPLCYGLFYVLLRSSKWAAVTAILATSLFFSVAHYIGPTADQFSLFSFTFRALAGLFFAVLFVLRGLGITVGCHAAYDLLVGVFLGTNA